MASLVKNMPAIRKTCVRSQGQEDPLERGMVTTPLVLPRKSHVQRSLQGYISWAHKSRTQLSN